LTLFGNADPEFLAHDAWEEYELDVIGNNEAEDVIVDLSTSYGAYYVTNRKFAEERMTRKLAKFHEEHKAWLCGFLRPDGV